MTDEKKPEDIPPAAEAAMLERYHQEVVRNTLARGKELMPVALILKGGKLKEALGATFPSNEAKDQFAEAMRQRCSRHKADAICIISEAWALKGDGSNRQADRYPSLEHHPDRMDVIMYQLETYDGNWRAQAVIHQRPDGKGRMVGKIDWYGGGVTTGRFTHLLPPRYPTPAQVDAYVALARRKLAAAGLAPDKILHSDSLIGILEKQIRHGDATKMTEDMIDKMVSVLLLIDAKIFGGKGDED